MAGELITLICVVSGALAADLADAPDAASTAFERLIRSHGADMMPTRYASRDDDGSLFVTLMIADDSNADTLQAKLVDFPDVLSVYRKPSAAMP